MSFFNAEVNLEDNRPSVIAAAAALLAFDDRLTRRSLELKMNSISHCRFLEIVSCYSRIHFFFLIYRFIK